MNFTQLKSFHAVATAGGFTKAGKLLGLSQPAITIQVRALEEAYGVSLFHSAAMILSASAGSKT